MLIPLALLAQTAGLDADPSKAALTCAMSVAIVDATQSPMRITSEVSHFVMQAAKADPGTKPFLDRVGELTEQASAGTQTPDAAKALMPECDRRFPLARGNDTVRLPADSFDRDVMCFGVLALLKGAASQLEEDGGDAGPLDKIETAFAPISDRLTDAALKAHQITSDAGFAAAMGEQLRASLALGNAESVARACGTAPF
jgi:hypothetical protein